MPELTPDTTIQEDEKGPSVTALPYFDGASPGLSVDWATVPNPTPSDWIGVHAIGAPDTTYRTYIYTNGMQYGSGKITIPASTPPGGYELRLFSNDGFTCLAAGEDLGGGFGVVAQSLLDSGVSSTGVSPGTTIHPHWSDIPYPTASDWIGLYARGASDTTFLSWIYTNGKESGTGNLVVPAGARTGMYELRLFSNDSVTRLAVTGFDVNGPARVTAVLGGIPNVPPGGQLKFNWSGVQSTGFESDWVGLYRVGASDTDYRTWVYISGAAGNGQLTIPLNTPPGAHELRLFTDGGFGRLATSQRDANVETTASLKFATGAMVASPAGQVVAYWQDLTNPTPLNWVGFYRSGAADTAYLAWTYTSGRSRGRRSLTVPPGLDPGVFYQLRLFGNNSYNLLNSSGYLLL